MDEHRLAPGQTLRVCAHLNMAKRRGDLTRYLEG
jgi:hypothetical protein